MLLGIDKESRTAAATSELEAGTGGESRAKTIEGKYIRATGSKWLWKTSLPLDALLLSFLFLVPDTVTACLLRNLISVNSASPQLPWGHVWVPEYLCKAEVGA